MYIDNDLVLSDAQDLTGAAGSASSTYYIDQLAAADAMGDGCWVQFLVDTLFSGTTGQSVTFALQTDTSSGFATAITTVVSAQVIVASLVAGYVPLCVKLPVNPSGMKRYIRAYYTSTGGLAAGKIDCRIVKDIDKSLDKVL